MPRRTTPERLVRDCFRTLRTTLDRAARNAVALHDARVATRQLRAVLPPAADDKRARDVRRDVRHLTRALGPLRELDVALEHVDELAHADVVPDDALRGVRRTLMSARKEARAKLRREVDDVRLGSLERRTLKVVHAHAADPAARLEDVRSRAAALRAAVDQAGVHYVADHVHAVRIAVKKLRYVLAAVDGAAGGSTAAARSVLEEAQDLLGRLHDYEVLASIVEARAREAGEHGEPDESTIRVAAHVRQEVQALHEEYLRRRRALTALARRLERAPSATRVA